MSEEMTADDARSLNDLILPSTRVAALLDQFPELEDVLISLAPPFKKLKNPILRKSVAKVASLKQAAIVARMPITTLINTLRSAVGQPPYQGDPEARNDEDPYPAAQPDWFDPTRIVATIDERAEQNADEMTLAAVLRAISQGEPRQIVELITTFIPAPGIDLMRAKGLLIWVNDEGTGIVRTYACKPLSSPSMPEFA